MCTHTHAIHHVPNSIFCTQQLYFIIKVFIFLQKYFASFFNKSQNI